MYVNFVENRKMKKVLLVLFLVGFTVVSQAATVNVDIQDSGHVTYAGIAAAPDVGTTWNACLWNNTLAHQLLDSQGNPTDVSIWLERNLGEWQYNNDNALMRDYAFNNTVWTGGNTGRFTLFSNLAAGRSGLQITGTQAFDIYVYTMGDTANQHATFELRHAGGTTVQTATGDGPFNGTFSEGDNYLKFSNVIAKPYYISSSDNGYEFEFFWGKADAAQGSSAINGIQLVHRRVGVAWNPNPADGQTGIPLDVDLSWKTGQDPKNIDQQNPDITHHYLYFRHDPNFLEMTEPTAIIAADGPSASYHISGLLRDKTYYWRVDEILNNGPAGDPNFVIPGNVWRFSTILSAPTIPSNGHPTNLLVYPGADAVVKLRFTSYSPASVTWHRYVDGENDIALNDKFGNVIDPIKYAVETDMSSEAQLTIYNAVADDEGYYYAVVSNAEQMTVQSKMARLAVRRLVAYFPMEIIENGATLDVESGYSLTLANDLLESNLATLAAGVDELGGNSLLLSNTVSSDPNFYGQYGVIEPGVVDYEDLTIAAWVMWNGGADWQRIFDFGNDTNQYMFLTSKTGTNLRFVIANGGAGQELNTAQLTANQWYHVVVTLDGNTGRLYVNGELKATNTAMTINPIDFKPTLNYIGKSQFAVDPYFNGRIDDLKIYNYARTVEEVAQDYLAVRGEWICDQSLPVLTCDFDGNCRVDLSDFAIFASEWLQSNRIYPEQ
jgi:hypothetical protein